ncbi:hypothetical protein ACWEK5_20570 [Rhodococcus koreensis]
MLIYLGMSARALATSKNALATTSYKGCVPGNLLELMSGIRPDWGGVNALAVSARGLAR